VQEAVPVIRARQNFEATTIRLQKEADVKNLIDEYVSFLSCLIGSGLSGIFHTGHNQAIPVSVELFTTLAIQQL
jgi:hypothetical protein